MNNDIIKAKAKEFNIIETGITSAENIEFIRDVPEFFKTHKAKTAIMSIQNYNSDLIKTNDNLHGIIAPFARGNYYKELRKKQEKLAKFLKSEYGASCYISSNGPIREKPLACKAGLGSYGMNHIISSPKYGSNIIIGEIITDIEIEFDEPSEEFDNRCLECGLCIKSCPSKALRKNMIINRERCLQHLSQNIETSPEFWPIWGKRFYGCSSCQDVCPKNIHAEKRKLSAEEIWNSGTVYLPEIIFLNDLEIKEKFKGRQMSAGWINPEALIKNALIILSQSDEGREYLYKFKEFGRESLKGYTISLIEYSFTK